MEYSIGIDIGGTKIATGIVGQQGNVRYKRIHPTPNSTNREIVDLLKQTVSEYMKLATEENINLVSVGIGSAGQIDYKNGRILSGTVNIKDWNNIDIRESLSHTTNLPIYLDNDANTFAIAEHQLGSGKGVDDLVCLTLGTGIGGGIVSDGNVIRGKWGGAAELGHMSVNFNGPDCNCGSKGCIETYASGTGIANRMREKLNSIDAGKRISYTEHPDMLTSKEVFEWNKTGLPEAKEVIDQAITALSFGIVNMIHTFNPSLIIFGGGLAEANRWLIEEVQNKVNAIGMPSLVKGVEMKVSKLGYDTGLIGAAYQVWATSK
ncbi:ROK family protein [Oceanobacillus longus]|uniref:ROK family protein n=1 Tax=Oceanobacillus longus TaxID=930120 RepID=A0ABV8GZS5_9BACI